MKNLYTILELPEKSKNSLSTELEKLGLVYTSLEMGGGPAVLLLAQPPRPVGVEAWLLLAIITDELARPDETLADFHLTIRSNGELLAASSTIENVDLALGKLLCLAHDAFFVYPVTVADFLTL